MNYLGGIKTGNEFSLAIREMHNDLFAFPNFLVTTSHMMVMASCLSALCQLSRKFHVHSITSDISWYNLTLWVLDTDTISKISRIIRSSPPTETYLALKPAIIPRIIDSPNAQLHKLLTGVKLSDQSPSQLLRHMRFLAASRIADIIRVKWLDLLSQ